MMKTVEYFVEYIDELGNEQCEIWSQYALDKELDRGDVKILRITLAYHLLEELGIVSE